MTKFGMDHVNMAELTCILVLLNLCSLMSSLLRVWRTKYGGYFQVSFPQIQLKFYKYVNKWNVTTMNINKQAI